MSLFESALRKFRNAKTFKKRPPLGTVRRLRLEPLESRELLTTTAPFTIVNNTIADAQNQLAVPDNEIYLNISSKDFATTPTYYYYDSSGNAHQTLGLGHITSFPLISLSQTGTHSYTINLPESLPTDPAFGPNSLRVYISINGPLSLTVNPDGSVTGPAQNNAFWDFFELSMSTPKNPTGNLSIDTTNVDQFGFPLHVTLDSTDTTDNPPDGIGISASRASVISQFQTFVAGANNPYQADIWPVSAPINGPYRLVSPDDVLTSLAPAQVADNQMLIRTSPADAIGPTDTTIHVYTAGAFPDPTDGPFTIQIDNEKMSVTAAALQPDDTTIWTVTRGVDGTSPASHATTSFITPVAPAMSATQTTLTVSNDVGFPAQYPFPVRVDTGTNTEIMQVTSLKSTNKDGTTTWNVERGQGGTTAVAHDEQAEIYYNPAVSLGLNDIFNGAVDKLFSDATSSTPLVLQSLASGTEESYTGTLTLSGSNEVLRFKSSDTTDNTDYDVYYPFFNDNRYLWAGYTPTQTTIGPAPAFDLSNNLAGLSPSAMVFSCSGVFDDQANRPGFNATQQKILADLENQMVSALNRGVAELAPSSWTDQGQYWGNNSTGQPWNQYAQFLHKTTVSIDGKNYGFPFDDQGGDASVIGVSSFTSATITMSPWGELDAPGPGPGPGPSGSSLRPFIKSSPIGQQQSFVLAPAVTVLPQTVTSSIISGAPGATHSTTAAPPASLSNLTLLVAPSTRSLLTARPKH